MDGADVYEGGESDEDCELRIEDCEELRFQDLLYPDTDRMLMFKYKRGVECEELCFQGCSKDCGLRLCGC